MFQNFSSMITCLRSAILFFSASFLFFLHAGAQSGGALMRSTPEAEGVSSVAIAGFLDATSKSKTEFHSFMLLRHGKVIAEGWWDPYAPQLRHTLYSCSKSFTATAIGFAVQEKLLSVDDKVISLFPDNLPDTVGDFLSKLTVKDVLMMSDGMDPDPSFIVSVRDSNWIKGFLSTQIRNEPGSKFLYNSLGTYMLSAIIQKVTGQKTIDYLKPRFFDPLGIAGMDWETDTRGINTGGWGLRVKTEDMAKFAEFFLQKGNWNGKQLLPVSWIEDASTAKIMQDPNAPQSRKDSSDWLQGYCYQMWRCRNNAYRGDGAFGQFMIVMPDQDAALAITAETADMQEEINLVWKYLLPAFKSGRLPQDRKAYAALRKQETNLRLPKPDGDKVTATALHQKTFSLDSNALHLKNISFDVSNDACTVRFQTDTSTNEISFGRGKWRIGETLRPGLSLTASAIENTSMLYPAKVAASYSWQDANTLSLILRYIESPHSETFTCHFNGDRLNIDYAKSAGFGKNSTMISGTAQ